MTQLEPIDWPLSPKRSAVDNVCCKTHCPAFLFQVRNEPKNIFIAAEYIAKVKGISQEEVIEVTTQNALKLFPKLKNFLLK